MTTKPIAFTGQNVLLIQSGAKTETRRVLPFQPPDGAWPFFIMCSTVPSDEGKWQFRESKDHLSPTVGKPFRTHRPGDLLWVQEAHRLAESTWTPSKRLVFCEYVADGLGRFLDLTEREWSLLTARKGWPPRPDRHSSITPPRFMYRSLSRLTLRVKAVRVERLHAITEAGARAEGCDSVASYRALWESIHGPGSWASNPWVSVTSFEVVR